MIELNLLLIDGNKKDYELIKGHLKDIPNILFYLDWVNDFEEGNSLLENTKYDLFLIEESWPDKSGLELLRKARREKNDKPVIILTEEEDRDIDFAAMAEGADDYIIKSKLSDLNLERSIRYCYERYKTKKELEQRESMYRNLFSKSVDAIVIVDRHCNIKESNQAMNGLFSIEKGQEQKFNLKELFLFENYYNDFVDKLKEKGLLKRHATQMRGKDGQKLSCELTTSVLFDLDHNIAGYQIIINDLTLEKKNEKRIMRAEKLGMTGRIARSIAHEVRNPLTNINLALEQIKEELKGGSAEGYLDIIQRSSNRINKLISELLNSAKPGSLSLKKSSLKKVLEESLALAKDRIKLKEIALKKDIPGDIQLMFDQVSLKTALLNIIINAIEAMEEQEGILEVRLFESLYEAHIEIKDNGEGIEPETLNQLFDPFFTGKSKGMGLGLTSTQNIIQQHQGNIDVESELGKGTTFIINLPKNVKK